MSSTCTWYCWCFILKYSKYKVQQTFKLMVTVKMLTMKVVCAMNEKRGGESDIRIKSIDINRPLTWRCSEFNVQGSILAGVCFTKLQLLEKMYERSFHLKLRRNDDPSTLSMWRVCSTCNNLYWWKLNGSYLKICHGNIDNKVRPVKSRLCEKKPDTLWFNVPFFSIAPDWKYNQCTWLYG